MSSAAALATRPSEPTGIDAARAAQLRAANINPRTGLATGLALLGAVIAVVLWHLYRLRARTAVALREKNMEIRRAQDQLVESEKQHEAEKVRTRIARDIHRS